MNDISEVRMLKRPKCVQVRQVNIYFMGAVGTRVPLPISKAQLKTDPLVCII
jgi:hypothetical protein